MTMTGKHADKQEEITKDFDRCMEQADVAQSIMERIERTLASSLSNLQTPDPEDFGDLIRERCADKFIKDTERHNQ